MSIIKQLLKEVAQPKSRPEKNFKNQHEIEVIDHPVAKEDQFRSLKDKAMKRLADKNKDTETYDVSYVEESATIEVEMMQRQLNFICYAAEEIIDLLEDVGDPEEWFQNKLSGVFENMKSLHAYMEGDSRMNSNNTDYSPYYEGLNESAKVKKGSLELKDGSKVIVSAQDASLLNKMFNELNDRNRKEMEKVMMLDKEGYEEILGFAKEAL